MKFLIMLALFLSTPVFGDVYTDYSLDGTIDPTVTATDAPVKTLYFKTNSPVGIFQKQDNGSSTSWTKIAGNQVSSGGTWGTITGTLADQNDLQTALNAKQGSLGYTAENSANKDTDGTLASNSDTKYSSQKAVKTYVDGGVSSKQDVIPRTSNFYVDGKRVDSYTSDGSIGKPYKTIQAALNATGSLSAVTVYVAPGSYSENIIINNANLFALDIAGQGFGTVSIGTGVGDAITCTQNNDNLQNLSFHNLSASGRVNLIGASTGTNFGNNYIMIDADFEGGVNSVNNGGIVSTGRAILGGTIYLENQGTAFIHGGPFRSYGSLQVVTNNANPVPAGFGGTEVRMQNVNAQFSSISVDAGSQLTVRPGSRVGAVGGSLSVAGTLDCAGASILANITLAAGSTWANKGCEWLGTFTDSGAAVTDSASKQVKTLAASQGVQIKTAVAQPTCSASIRGLQWLIQGGAGVADVYQVCQKNVADAYAWATH